MRHQYAANAMKRLILSGILLTGLGLVSACELLFTPEAGHAMRSGSGATARSAADHAAAKCPDDPEAQRLAAEARKAADDLDQAQAKERQTRAVMQEEYAEFARAVQLQQDFSMDYPGMKKNSKAYQERIAAHEANVNGSKAKWDAAKDTHEQAQDAATNAADRASRLATQIYAQCPRNEGGQHSGSHSRGQEVFSHTKGQHQEPKH